MGHSRNSYTIPSPISLTSVFSSGVHPSQPPPPCGFVLWSSVERRLRPKSLFPEKSVTLHNKCSHSVWPGIQPSAGKLLLARGGFKLPPNMSHALKLPPLWSGRFWGRHGCAFKASGRGPCKTGDCGGSLFCNGTGGTPPATFVEFFLGKHHDSYAISLVDGYNLPVSITPYGGSGTCGDVRCVMSDLNLICPAALQVRSHDKRALVACKIACSVDRDAEAESVHALFVHPNHFEHFGFVLRPPYYFEDTYCVRYAVAHIEETLEEVAQVVFNMWIAAVVRLN
ncbi:thaumatin-like protein [Prosopis cineraria]|uniref:thaumatin-like protein n=1 Tax=Prosopis cineraria TaxID=364024 RepID=UPI00240FB1EA|nr:thaumatin-like protein [Prosopis cineraria]